jgi:flagellar biosynthesis/type III secretory pathway protein FliH
MRRSSAQRNEEQASRHISTHDTPRVHDTPLRFARSTRSSRVAQLDDRQVRAPAELLYDELATDPKQVRAAQMLMSYIARVLGVEQAQQLRHELAQLAPAAENAMQSIADSWEQKGIEKGRAEGIEKGQRNLVERLLAKKFGSPLPPDVLERLGVATLEQLEQYADRVLDAKQLSDVFEGSE